MSIIEGNNTKGPPPIIHGRGVPPRQWQIVMSYRAGFEAVECRQFLQEVFNFRAGQASAHIQRGIKENQSVVYIGPKDSVETKKARIDEHKEKCVRNGGHKLNLMHFIAQQKPL